MTCCRSRGSSLVFFVLCLFACAIPASAGCRPIEGIEALLAPGRVLLLGELHGTVESPAFTREVACHAGGSAWICAPDCGPAQLVGSGTERSWAIEIDAATRPAGHHG